jgi:nitroreductase
VVAPEAADRCINCGHCLAVCPGGAITLAGISSAGLPSFDPDLTVSPEAAAQFLRSRRSVRRFRRKPVDKETIRNCIDTARFAPSSMNVQPVHWIVVEDPDLMVLLVDLTAKSLRRLPYFLPFVKAWEQGTDLILRSAPQLVVVHAPKKGLDYSTDCNIALTYFEMAAHGHGLGTCWAGLFTHAAGRSKAISAALCLPESHKVFGALMLGRPKYGYQRLPERKRPPVRFT